MIQDIIEIQNKYRGREVPLEEVFADLRITPQKNSTNNSLCPDCSTPLVTEIEQRESGYSEEITYCPGCGATGVGK